MPTWTTVFDNSAADGTDDGDGEAGLTIVQHLDAADLTDAGSDKTQARITIKYGLSSGTSGAPTTFRFGKKAAAGDEYDFAGTPATVTFPEAITPGPDAEYVSNAFDLPEVYDGSSDYLLAWYTGVSSTSSYTQSGAWSASSLYYKATGDEAATVDKSGYTQIPDFVAFLKKVEVAPPEGAPPYSKVVRELPIRMQQDDYYE
jgi:hypothetical protein